MGDPMSLVILAFPVENPKTLFFSGFTGTTGASKPLFRFQAFC